MAFSYTIKGETAGVGGSKKIFGTWDAASVTLGTVTWAPASTNFGAVIAGGVVQSTAVTTAAATAGCKITTNTLVVDCEASAAGYWWVEVQ